MELRKMLDTSFSGVTQYSPSSNSTSIKLSYSPKHASLLEARVSGHGDGGGGAGRRQCGRPCRVRVCASGGR
eukprot:4066177-Pleurochrysis_carterae.AAC.1